MRILVVAHAFPPEVRSGTGTLLATLVEGLRARHEVRLVAGFARDRTLLPRDALAVDLGHAGSFLGRVELARAAHALARSFRPEVVISDGTVAPGLGAPVVAILGPGRGGPEAAGRLGRRLHGLRHRVFSRVLVATEAARAAAIAAGAPPSRTVVLPLPIDLGGADEEPTLPRPAPLVLCQPGRILPTKAQHVAIDAVARLAPADKRRVHLRVVGAVGDAVYHDQLRVQAYRQPVSFHVDVPDLGPFLQEADLVLYPSLVRCGVGFPLLEAMGRGRAVVWFEDPSRRALTGGHGVIVPGQDAVALRDAIRDLLDDPGRRATLGEAARRHVAVHHDAREVLARHEALLLEVTRRG